MKPGDLVLFTSDNQVMRNLRLPYNLYREPNTCDPVGLIVNNTLCLVIAAKNDDGIIESGQWVLLLTTHQQLGWRPSFDVMEVGP